MTFTVVWALDMERLMFTHKPLVLPFQIVVIVTDDWHVMCFDPELNLKWEVSLPLTVNLLEEAYAVKSLGVLITSHSVQKNNGGLIIVGGNFMHKTHHTKELPVEKIE